MKKIVAIIVVTVSSMAWGQDANPVSNAARNMLSGRSKNMVAAAEEMPADKYSYRPTAEQQTFAHIVEHTTGMNNMMCARLTDVEPPKPGVKESDGKDKLAAAFRQSFEFCTAQLSKLQDARLGDDVAMGDHKATKSALLLNLTSGWADHYSQMAMYLRLNGMLPPTAKKP